MSGPNTVAPGQGSLFEVEPASDPRTDTEAEESRGDALARLAPWRDAGVLGPADVHLAVALARLSGMGVGADGSLGADEASVALAAALAARAPRLGHVCLDLATVRESVPAEVEGDVDSDAAAALGALPWPADIDAWRTALAGSSLVTEVDPGAELSTAGPTGRPLVLAGTLLYLERYKVHEDRVAAELLRRAAVSSPAAAPVGATEPRGRTGAADHDALFAAFGSSPQQRAAAEAGARGLLSVIVGGPGTGKTTTVAALLALLLADAPESRIALVAPTGKAAARMDESIKGLAAELRSAGLPGVEVLADRLSEAEVSTVHRRLGYRHDGTFRHDHRAPLVHDVVIVDETSMVSLPLMARLLDAVRPDARLVLVGDPGQLASVEAGSVLGDIAGPAVEAAFSGAEPPVGPLAGCVSVLTESYRFPTASPVGRLAAAVRAGDADGAIAVLTDAAGSRPGPSKGSEPSEALDAPDEVTLRWTPVSADTPGGAEAVAAVALAGARRTMACAVAGAVEDALDALGGVRVLCAHRRGPFGVAWWNLQFEDWLAGDGPRLVGTYVGRPLLVTANDAIKGLYNGDLGVVVRSDDAVWVAFPDVTGPRLVAPARVEAAETVHAMTIHKSQGSEFDEIVVVLPPPESRLATRELFYTAVTRARRVVTVVGGEAAVRRAIDNRVVRQTGLSQRLWPDVG